MITVYGCFCARRAQKQRQRKLREGQMDDDKAMIIMTSGPETPRRCATPFFFATLGRAMDYDVTMFFTIDGILLLNKGLAEDVYPKAGGKPVSEFIHEALESGVKFTACTAATAL